ncbi:MAG: hypothetical protein K2X55_24120 [Burkholderiaceae bacterium]|nr:hypothetical protein [Burkholderiaceae bacterium]
MQSELNISFRDFFEKNPQASTRLVNVILRAFDDAYVPFPTVLDYWENRNAAHTRMRLIDGFGEKSFAELNRRISDFLAAS